MENNKEKINFKNNLSLYFKILMRYKWLFFLILFITLIVESLSLLDNFLIKQIIDYGTKFLSISITKNYFIKILLIIAGVFALGSLLSIIGKWIRMHFINLLESKLILDTKKRFFNHVIGLSYNFHTTHKTGSLISRLNRGRSAIEGLTDVIVFNFTPLLFQLIVVTLSLIYLDLTSAIVIFLIITSFIIYSILFQRSQQTANLKANEAEDFEKGNISDFLTNIESIKYFGKEKEIKDRFSSIAEETNIAIKTHWNYFRWLDAGQTIILAIGVFFLMYFPILKLLNGQLSIGTLVFINMAYTTLVSELFNFVYGLRNFYRVMADVDSLFKYEKITNEIKDSQNAKVLKIKDGTIEFKNVNFSYGKREIFEDFNLKIPKDKKIAIVGHSGSGKSTLIKLLFRLYDIDSGEIIIDNKNIKEFTQESLRREMSIVPQECILFDDTIYNNILFSRPNATKEEVLNAIRFARLDKTIENFPLKYNTIVGERGVKLSGGEKQRVSIARAILADKKILVLDEATSALDSETEHEIQRELQELMKNRTTIIIAHRLSTIMNADIIIVMKKGNIIQMGTHKELIRKNNEYKRLWNLQKGGYIK